MKVKPLLEKLTEKWPAKAICIIAACFFYMFNQYNSLDQKSFPVTLNVLQEGEMICTTHIPSSVSVTIKTNGDNIGQVSAEGIVAILDLNYITQEGNYDVPVYVDLPPTLKSFDPLQMTVYPEKIKVHLEKNISRPIKIVPRGAGQSPYGYTVKKFVSEPPYVEIFGPRSIVESIASIQTEAIIVDEKTSTFTERKKLINQDRLIKFNSVTEVDVTIEIDYTQGMRSFSSFPIEVKNLKEDFEVVQKLAADFAITGPQLSLDEYEPMPDVLSINLAEIEDVGTYEIPVEVLIPQEFRLANLPVESVTIDVREKKPESLENASEYGEAAAQ